MWSRARSMPSLLPVMVMVSEFSSVRGTWILVAVVCSSSFRFLPFWPRMKRWCSLGIWMLPEACVWRARMT
uniref:Putative secreted protein n=1 Tax=Ixodes ricinus TaxID=34613 RepID=A0A6B0TS14_IXORI